MTLTRSHGLGNDYLVADPAELPFVVSPARVRLLCDRHLGVGSDGFLLLAGERQLRIFNPDGTEAEKSGNGLRIFARWLYDTGRVPEQQFVVQTAGGAAAVRIHSEGAGRVREVTVDMGVPRFRDDLRSLSVEGQQYQIVALSVGNPHCVLPMRELDVTKLRRLGPLVEHHPAFPERTNVQLARAVGRQRVELLIWERGAGETLASGSSASAVVAAFNQLGAIDGDVDVTAAMPGGDLRIRVDTSDQGRIWMRGPVEEVARISLSRDLIDRLNALP
jgi:diaminopimelate epimerase